MKQQNKYATLTERAEVSGRGGVDMTLKRICITLPQALIVEMDEIVPINERSELFAELLEEYLEAVSAEEDRMVAYGDAPPTASRMA